MNVELAGGIDVSHYKKQIDWAKVKETGVSFAFMKATEADHFVDSRFDYNWTRARRVGIIRGAYHFFRPLVDPVLQAQNFLKVIGNVLHETDLPPVLDVEAYPDFVEAEYKRISVQERLDRVGVWLRTVEQATGKIPIIYTEYYAWFDFLNNSTRFSRNPLWIANYRVDKPKIPAEDWGGNGWTFWQTTERGIIPGIRDEAPCVDLDLYHGSLADLHGWLNITGERAHPPDVTNGDMMAAIVDAAEKAGGQSNDWVVRAGLSYLVNPVSNSLRPYDGPAVSELPLRDQEKNLLAKALESYEGRNSASWSITHQDLINAFYYAASLEEMGGWSLVERAGIGYIGNDRDVIYTGPVVAELPGLTLRQKEAIMAYLGVYRPEPEQEAPVEPEEPAEVPEPVAEPVEAAQPEESPADPEPSLPEAEPEPEYTEEELLSLDPTYSSQMNNQAVI
ncbi:MAG TPA: GH25 family lysozyme, partial [Anaerolineales bacterium]|nr:GH25 family lysozyme [Anaerolineales bacterium]